MTTATKPTLRYIRPYLYEKQLQAIFHDKRYGLVEASTKSGKTHGCILWLVEQAFLYGRPNRHYWWVAPVYPQSKIAYRRLKLALPRGTFKANDSDLTITLRHNQSVIDFKSAEKPDNLYGEDVYAAVIDEGSRVREESWHAVRSTLTATKGLIRVIGNVRGRRNWMYKLARTNDPDMMYARITAYDAADAGIIDHEEIESAKRALPADVFKQLYLAEAADDGGNPFGTKYLEQCVDAYNLMPHTGELPVIAYGVDLAKSTDWTVVIGLDYRGAVCVFERWQGPWEHTTERVQNIVGNTLTYCDSTGVGDPIVERLQKTNRNVEGFKFTGTSKQQLMEGLAVAIQHAEICFPDNLIAEELHLFEYEFTRTGVKYRAPEGVHDDCVDALGLAAMAFTSKPHTRATINAAPIPEAYRPVGAGILDMVH